MNNTPTSSKAFLASIPSGIAILCQNVIVVVLMLYGPLRSGSFWALCAWLISDTASGFFFGKISDHRKRKLILVGFQISGVIAGFILLYFDLTILVMCIIGLIFNPTPVCRAAFLDNFPNISPLRVLGTTYLISYIPQAIYPVLNIFSAKQLITAVLITLFINIPLMIWLFNDNYDEIHDTPPNPTQHSVVHILFKNSFMFLLVAAFIFAETPFNVMWDFLDLNLNTRNWFPLVTLSTMAGITLTMVLAKKLPHLLMITLIYAVSIIFPFIMCAIYYFKLIDITVLNALLIYTSFSCALGGLYLPLVADAIIRRLGSKNRGFGAALIEFVDTFSSSLAAPGINKAFYGGIILLPIFGLLYIFATFFQNLSHKRREPD